MKKLILGLLTLFVLVSCTGKPSESIAGQWELVSYGSVSSQTPVAPDVDTFIEFKTGGSLSGNSGCNGFGGDYKMNDTTIAFNSIVSTLMFCQGPLGDQEAVTLAVFQESAPFVLDGNLLTITSADGNFVIVLARK